VEDDLTPVKKRIVCVVASGLSLVIGQGLVFDDVEFRVCLSDGLQDEDETLLQSGGDISKTLVARALTAKKKTRIALPGLSPQSAFLFSVRGADFRRNLSGGSLPRGEQNQDILSAPSAKRQFGPSNFNMPRHRAGALFVWPHPDRGPPCFSV
jgi:hypothetical protein